VTGAIVSQTTGVEYGSQPGRCRWFYRLHGRLQKGLTIEIAAVDRLMEKILLKGIPMLSHWTQNDLIVNSVQLHYYRTGQGDKRPLVLVHGFSDNGLCWTPVARDLESEYDVIMPDMRGHGLSERTRPSGKVDMAADLAGLIRSLGLDHPVVCGHSMGAMVTYQLGVRFPELASALVLEDPPWWLSQHAPPFSDTDGNPFEKWVKNLAGQTLDDLLMGYHQDHPDWPEELLRPMCESKKQLDPAILESMQPKLRTQEVDWSSTVQHITLPILLFVGNPELGGIVTPEVVAKVGELNPKVPIVHIPDVGHFIRFDKFTLFMDALRVFLKQLPS
jgi:N-formylmaleamate deformylase